MDKKIILSVIALVAVSIGLILLIPSEQKQNFDTLPWHINHPTPDTTQVFGLVLGKTTLLEAETNFPYDVPKISLFKPSDADVFSIEAFYDEVNFNGLRAQLGLTLNISQEEMGTIYQRGLRMSSTASGKRITLTPEDATRAGQATIRSITYLPAASLDDALIEHRFGKPAERIRETSGELVHWLYPQHGLDIAVPVKGKPILQYVELRNFDLLRAPLLAKGGKILQ